MRKLLQGTAQLEFWETYEYSNLLGAITAANDFLKELEAVATEADEIVEEVLAATEEVVTEENSLLDQLAADSALTDTSSLTFEQFAAENPLYAVFGS